MGLWEDYTLTLDGELSVGAPDSLWTRFGAFRCALHRWLFGGY